MRREALQWFGLLGAPLAWTAQHLLGYGFAEGACNSGGSLWGVEPRAWQIGVTSGAAAVAVAAGIAALAVFLGTRGSGPEPPLSRLHFFAASSPMVVVVFLALIVMSGVGGAYFGGCDPS